MICAAIRRRGCRLIATDPLSKTGPGDLADRPGCAGSALHDEGPDLIAIGVVCRVERTTRLVCIGAIEAA